MFHDVPVTTTILVLRNVREERIGGIHDLKQYGRRIGGIHDLKQYGRVSSHTRNNNNPRSAQLMVICRINSSKHCEYNSSRIGHIPVSRACRDCN